MRTTVTNATAMYTIMMLVFATGMWAIVVYGSTLLAPMDLAGQWELSPDDAPAAAPTRAVVEQSGRFLRLRTADDAPVDLRMANERGRATSVSARPSAVLNGGSITATFESTPAPSVYRLTIRKGDTTARYTARIVERTYPRPAANRPQNLTPPAESSVPNPATSVERATPTTHNTTASQPATTPSNHAR